MPLLIKNQIRKKGEKPNQILRKEREREREREREKRQEWEVPDKNQRKKNKKAKLKTDGNIKWQKPNKKKTN